jgi:hypothetical protein
MALKSLSPSRRMEPLDIFKRFTYDTLLTAGIYSLLVGATLVLRYLAGFLKASPFHYHVLEILEGAIFLSGTLIAAIVLIYVTVVTTNDLVRSLGAALRAAPRSGDSVSEQQDTAAS